MAKYCEKSEIMMLKRKAWKGEVRRQRLFLLPRNMTSLINWLTLNDVKYHTG